MYEYVGYHFFEQLSAGHAFRTMTIEAARALLCNESTFLDAVSATALRHPLNVHYMYYDIPIIPIQSIITLVLKLLIMSHVFDLADSEDW
jgi:hypothetical protein